MNPFSIISGNWRSVLLLTSLCLNIVLVAFLATRWIEGRFNPLIAGPPQLIDAVARRLPRADAEILRSVYRGKEAQFTAAQREYRQALAGAVQLLSQPQLDVAALRSAVMNARDKRLGVGDLAIETFLEALPQMSAEGRRGLTSRIRPR
jgi:uncharacterized membrane protein